MKQVQPRDIRDLRIPIKQKAKLITSDGNQMEVLVTDISVGGCRLKADETFYDGENIVMGEAVVVKVERRYDLQAKVIWANGCEAGCVFLDSTRSL